MTWLQKAADNKSADAMQMLGELYMEDDAIEKENNLAGLPRAEKNDHKALDWLLKAAKQNCPYEIAEDIAALYARQKDHMEEYRWCLVMLSFLADEIDQIEELIHILTVLQFIVLTRLVAAFKHGATMDCQKTEDYALMAYWWMWRVQELGATPQQLAQYSLKTKEILGWIGECASALQKPYANAVLQEAMEMGCGFAAVLLVPAALNRAMELKAPTHTPTYFWLTEDFVMPLSPIGPKQIKAADEAVKKYFPLVKQASTDDSLTYRQAEALYRLSHFYIFGLCCKRSANEAHALLERAAALGHQSAQNLLNKMFRKKLFGWEFI